MVFFIGGIIMYDKGYFIQQALGVLGFPSRANGEDHSGNWALADIAFPRAMDELAGIVSFKMNKKRVSLPRDTNVENEFGVIPGDFGKREAWYIIPPDFYSLENINVTQYRISGDHIVTTETMPEIVIEYTATMNPAEIPNNQRNLLVYILAKHTAFAIARPEISQMCEALIDKEITKIKFATPNRKTMKYFDVDMSERRRRR